MGAPKQKWTAEEEAALKAGVIKHGAGKWRTILKDPEFSGVLSLRSNVDLKDKWRNMSVMANGWSSREKSKLAVKGFTMSQNGKRTLQLSILLLKVMKIFQMLNLLWWPILQCRLLVQREQLLDNLIMEAITSLKEPGGSNKTTIAAYIEEQYWPPHDFRRILSAKLKYLTSIGKLIKEEEFFHVILGGRQRISPRVEKDDSNMLTKSQIDSELAKMRTMTAQEAAAAAARAVAEAEAAIAEAEEATREAEAAEADAEAAQAFAEAAMKTLKSRTPPNMVNLIAVSFCDYGFSLC
ncbi:hypothetical protein GH714_031378 [Hevea brasiliensis]|uniref:MYB transcription factor n=1 Tax=Hevea brasiliensis TaxID=3981 RepID=A0A6A6N8H1_HEVBR|nr:hypothetical protein GH714_031378 [Hevea brasiliensis]